MSNVNPIDRRHSITAVARAAGTTVENIRNYVHRGILMYPGGEPRAGYPREFPLYGAYEVALLNHFQRAGLTLDAARAVWRALIAREQEREAADGITATAAPPRNLAEVLRGETEGGGKVLAVMLLAEKTGRAGTFKVLVRDLLWSELIGLRRGFSTVFPVTESDPPTQIHLFDLNRVIATVNRVLLTAESDA